MSGQNVVYRETIQILKDWKEDGTSHGSPTEWGLDKILVFDTLTALGRACLNYVLRLEGRWGQRPRIQDWGDAIGFQEQLIDMVCGESR